VKVGRLVRDCRPGTSCTGLASVEASGSLVLRRVEYRGTVAASPRNPFRDQQFGPAALFCMGDCTVADSIIEEPAAASGGKTGEARRLLVPGSLLVAGENGVGAKAYTAEISRSVIRGSRSQWAPNGSVGLDVEWAKVTNSLLAGQVGFRKTGYRYEGDLFGY